MDKGFWLKNEQAIPQLTSSGDSYGAPCQPAHGMCIASATLISLQTFTCADCDQN